MTDTNDTGSVTVSGWSGGPGRPFDINGLRVQIYQAPKPTMTHAELGVLIDGYLRQFEREAANNALRADLAAMTAERDALREAIHDYRGIVTECRDQWGDDYLWDRLCLDEEIADIEAALSKATADEKGKP